jgi:hypothetical protein
MSSTDIKRVMPVNITAVMMSSNINTPINQLPESFLVSAVFTQTSHIVTAIQQPTWQAAAITLFAWLIV